MQGFDPILARHHVVEKNNVILFITAQSESLLSAFRGIHLYKCLLDEVSEHQQVRRVVIDHENTGIFGSKSALIPFSGADTLRIGRLIVPERIPPDHLLLQFKREHRAHAVNTLHLERRPHHLQQTLGDTHAQTGSLDVPVVFFIDAFKLRKDAFDILLPDPDPSVPNSDPKHYLIGFLFDILISDGKGDHALFGVFDGIGQDIRDDLLYADLITVQDPGNLTIKI